MEDLQKDLNNKNLKESEEITLIYEGPSFDGRMELPDLTAQLNAVNQMMMELIRELYKQKKIKEPDKTKIYLKLKKGSFEQNIIIQFFYPLAVSIVGGIVVALVSKYLNRKERKTEINMSSITNNYLIVDNLASLSNPLKSVEDKLTIKLPNEDKEVIAFNDGKLMRENIKILKEETKITKIYEEEFFGSLNSVNLSKEKYGFIKEETEKIIPVHFSENINLNEIKSILGERIWIKATCLEENGVIKKLDILEHKLKERKTLKEYIGNNETTNTK